MIRDETLGNSLRLHPFDLAIEPFQIVHEYSKLSKKAGAGLISPPLENKSLVLFAQEIAATPCNLDHMDRLVSLLATFPELEYALSLSSDMLSESIRKHKPTTQQTDWDSVNRSRSQLQRMSRFIWELWPSILDEDDMRHNSILQALETSAPLKTILAKRLKNEAHFNNHFSDGIRWLQILSDQDEEMSNTIFKATSNEFVLGTNLILTSERYKTFVAGQPILIDSMTLQPRSKDDFDILIELKEPAYIKFICTYSPSRDSQICPLFLDHISNNDPISIEVYKAILAFNAHNHALPQNKKTSMPQIIGSVKNNSNQTKVGLPRIRQHDHVKPPLNNFEKSIEVAFPYNWKVTPLTDLDLANLPEESIKNIGELLQEWQQNEFKGKPLKNHGWKVNGKPATLIRISSGRKRLFLGETNKGTLKIIEYMPNKDKNPYERYIKSPTDKFPNRLSH